MQEEQIKDLASKWETKKKALNGNINEDYSKAISEYIGIIERFSNNLRGKSKNLPRIKVTENLINSSLREAIRNIEKLDGGEEKFKLLFCCFNQILVYLYNLVILNPKDIDNINLNMSASLADQIALLETGLTNMEKCTLQCSQFNEEIKLSIDKMQDLNIASDESRKIYDMMEQNKKESNDMLSNVKQLSEEQNRVVDSIIEKIKANEKEIGEKTNELRSLTEGMSKENEQITNELELKRQELNHLIGECRKQHDVIKGLLPGATSVGLAESFISKAKKLKKSKLVALFLFILTIALIMWVDLSQGIVSSSSSSGIIAYLPKLIVIGPLIWIGWVFVKQYINLARLEEDYEFKAATSKAFVGYKDHMEYISKVKTENIVDGEKNNAMNLLSIKTIEILSRDPARFLGKSYEDATPLAQISKLFKSKDS